MYFVLWWFWIPWQFLPMRNGLRNVIQLTLTRPSNVPNVYQRIIWIPSHFPNFDQIYKLHYTPSTPSSPHVWKTHHVIEGQKFPPSASTRCVHFLNIVSHFLLSHLLYCPQTFFLLAKKEYIKWRFFRYTSILIQETRTYTYNKPLTMSKPARPYLTSNVLFSPICFYPHTFNYFYF